MYSHRWQAEKDHIPTVWFSNSLCGEACKALLAKKDWGKPKARLAVCLMNVLTRKPHDRGDVSWFQFFLHLSSLYSIHNLTKPPTFQSQASHSKPRTSRHYPSSTSLSRTSSSENTITWEEKKKISKYSTKHTTITIIYLAKSKNSTNAKRPNAQICRNRYASNINNEKKQSLSSR